MKMYYVCWGFTLKNIGGRGGGGREGDLFREEVKPEWPRVDNC